MTSIPKWAQEVMCEPVSLAPLNWTTTNVTSPSGQSYPIEKGIPIFANHTASYMNQVTRWPEVDRQNPSVRALEDHAVIFDNYESQLRNKIVIDMCAGGGIVSYYLAARYRCRVISIERAFNALSDYGDQFREYYKVDNDQVVRVCADALKLPIASNTIPVVVGSSWIHHFTDKVEILCEVMRVLEPGGQLIAHNEGTAGLLNQGTADEDQYVSRREYENALIAAGFVNSEVKGWSRGYRFVGWLKGSVDLTARKPDIQKAVNFEF